MNPLLNLGFVLLVLSGFESHTFASSECIELHGGLTSPFVKMDAGECKDFPVGIEKKFIALAMEVKSGPVILTGAIPAFAALKNPDCFRMQVRDQRIPLQLKKWDGQADLALFEPKENLPIKWPSISEVLNLGDEDNLSLRSAALQTVQGESRVEIAGRTRRHFFLDQEDFFIEARNFTPRVLGAPLTMEGISCGGKSEPKVFGISSRQFFTLESPRSLVSDMDFKSPESHRNVRFLYHPAKRIFKWIDGILQNVEKPGEIEWKKLYPIQFSISGLTLQLKCTSGPESASPIGGGTDPVGIGGSDDGATHFPCQLQGDGKFSGVLASPFGSLSLFPSHVGIRAMRLNSGSHEPIRGFDQLIWTLRNRGVSLWIK